jgi:hypothetical protein
VEPTSQQHWLLELLRLVSTSACWLVLMLLMHDRMQFVPSMAPEKALPQCLGKAWSLSAPEGLFPVIMQLLRR